jgi:hypothetical protein
MSQTFQLNNLKIYFSFFVVWIIVLIFLVFLF